uniref:WSN domain-containing protein n=1 Tax=Caenorhabditis tropicalis TaxID=1561998 RepID=A0A1I7UV75_9PELO
MNLIIRIVICIVCLEASTLSTVDPLKSAVRRLKYVSRAAHLAYIQEGFRSGFIDPDDFIEEYFNMGKYTWDLEDIRKGMDALGNEALKTDDTTLKKAEQVLQSLGAAQKEIQGMGDIEKWSSDSLKKEISEIKVSETISKLDNLGNQFPDQWDLIIGSISNEERENVSEYLKEIFSLVRTPNLTSLPVSLISESFSPIQKTLNYLSLKKETFTSRLKDSYFEYIKKIENSAGFHIVHSLFEMLEAFGAENRASGDLQWALPNNTQDLDPLLIDFRQLSGILTTEEPISKLIGMARELSELSEFEELLDHLVTCEPPVSPPVTSKVQKLSELVSGVDSLQKSLSKAMKELKGLLKAPGFQRILEMNPGPELRDLPGISSFKEDFQTIFRKIGNIHKIMKEIKKMAESLEPLEGLDDYHKEIKDYGPFFTCIQNSPPIPTVGSVTKELIDSGLRVLNRTEEARKLSDELVLKVLEMRGQPSSFLSSRALWEGTQGLSNMLKALEHKEEVLESLQYLQKNSEADLDTFELDILKMYETLEVFRTSLPIQKTSDLFQFHIVFEMALDVTGVDISTLKIENTNPKSQSKVDVALKFLKSMDFDFYRYHTSFKSARKFLMDFEPFFSGETEEEECPECSEVLDWPLFYFDPFVIFITSLLTAILIIFVYFTRRAFFRENRSENFDTVEMTTVIGLTYFRSLYAKILSHKKSKRAEEETPEEDFFRYFRDLYSFDSSVCSARSSNLLVEKHTGFQRRNLPISMYTRVKLEGNRFLDDFVHANIVDYPSGLRIIMTGGPQAEEKGKVSDIERFWWIAKQENVDQVVMLCQLDENGVTQCDQYYPENEGEYLKFNGLIITCKKKKFEYGGQIIVRKLVIHFEGEDKFEVTHYQYVGWPQNGNPQNLDMIYVLLCEIRTSWTPIMVHCSDGVGRTGCFGYIEMAYQKLKRDEEIEFGEILDLMRFERAGVVLSAKQYGFCAFMIGFYIMKDKVYYFYDENDKKIFKFLTDGYNGWDTVEREMIEKKAMKKMEKNKKIENFNHNV